MDELIFALSTRLVLTQEKPIPAPILEFVRHGSLIRARPAGHPQRVVAAASAAGAAAATADP